MRLTVFQGSGAALGAAIGQRFGDEIRHALAENATLAERFLPFHQSARGQALHRRLLALHRERYPHYVAELEGIGDGAGVPFESVLLINLRGEYRGYIGIDDGGECSTCALYDQRHALFAHNEDGSAIYRGRSYLIRVEPDVDVPFTALCYPGFLPGNAFGFNDRGICFCVNNVRPRDVQIGVGRHFMARSLFAARDLADAVERLSVEDRAAGFNYTLGSVHERRIVNVEVAPDAVDVRELSGAHFHANHYLYLETPQHRFASSLARQQRARTLLEAGVARDAAGVLQVLRDQGRRDLPIWRDGTAPDDGLTLLTAVFDLDAAELRVYPGPWEHARDPMAAMVQVSIG